MRRKLYDKINGRYIYLYTLMNEGPEVDICELGASINAIRLGGIDIALGFKSVNDNFDSGSYAGATIGRVANRIAGGRFILNNRPCFLNKNDGNNHLNGGWLGFDKQLFDIIKQKTSSIQMQYESADGEERYPGNLKFTVIFTVKDTPTDGELIPTGEKKAVKIQYLILMR